MGAGETARGLDLDSLSFEQLVEALEAVIAQMASGSVGIEEAAELYERAGALHAAAAERLRRVQERIERLEGGAAHADDPGR